MEPGNLGGIGFGAAPVCSETFTMAEDPKAFCCLGKINLIDIFKKIEKIQSLDPQGVSLKKNMFALDLVYYMVGTA